MPRIALTAVYAPADTGAICRWHFPYFGGTAPNGFIATEHPDITMHDVPVRHLALKDGETLVATVFDLLCANYGLDRGWAATTSPRLRRDAPFTPAWAERVTGVPRAQIIHVARMFAPTPRRPTAARWSSSVPG